MNEKNKTKPSKSVDNENPKEDFNTAAGQTSDSEMTEIMPGDMPVTDDDLDEELLALSPPPLPLMEASTSILPPVGS